MEHLDVSSFKLVRVAAVNDDDPLHQGAEVTRESRHHLGNNSFVLFVFLYFFFQCFHSSSSCLKKLRHADNEGGGAYHVPSDVLEVLVFATDGGQDEQLEDHWDNIRLGVRVRVSML